MAWLFRFWVLAFGLTFGFWLFIFRLGFRLGFWVLLQQREFLLIFYKIFCRFFVVFYFKLKV